MPVASETVKASSWPRIPWRVPPPESTRVPRAMRALAAAMRPDGGPFTRGAAPRPRAARPNPPAGQARAKGARATVQAGAWGRRPWRQRLKVASAKSVATAVATKARPATMAPATITAPPLDSGVVRRLAISATLVLAATLLGVTGCNKETGGDVGVTQTTVPVSGQGPVTIKGIAFNPKQVHVKV